MLDRPESYYLHHHGDEVKSLPEVFGALVLFSRCAAINALVSDQVFGTLALFSCCAAINAIVSDQVFGALVLFSCCAVINALVTLRELSAFCVCT